MLASLVVTLFACAPTPASIKIDGEPTAKVHALDAVAVNHASVLDANGAAIEPQPAITWTVTPDTVAKLEGDKVVPVANGEATISAAVGEVKAEYKLVVALPDAVAISGAAAGDTVKVGETKALTAAVKAGADDVAGQTIAWSVDNAAIATVDAATGAVTGVAPGAVKVTATSGSLSATLDLNVAAADAVAAAPATK